MRDFEEKVRNAVDNLIRAKNITDDGSRYEVRIGNTAINHGPLWRKEECVGLRDRLRYEATEWLLRDLPTPTPSSGEEVQAAMALAEAYSERMRNTETLDLLSSEGNARDVVWKEFRDRHTALYEKECAALSRYRNSKPAPSGGRGGA